MSDSTFLRPIRYFPSDSTFSLTQWRGQTGKTRASNNHNALQMNVITIIIHIKIHCYKYLDLYTSLFYHILDNVCYSIGK